jgi:hypothetical protein
MMPVTISVAVAGPELPSLVDVTVPVVLRREYVLRHQDRSHRLSGDSLLAEILCRREVQ